MKVATYTKSGAKSSSQITLDKKMFGVETESQELLKKVYLAYLANRRVNLAKTKTRGEVRGGGRKPIRQKGTGYARVGSSRNPIRTGGGVAFGPRGTENYNIRVTSRDKRQALAQALSLAAKAEKIIIADELKVASGRTKDAANFLSKIKAEGRVLVASDKPQELTAFRNIAGVSLVRAAHLNAFHILNADCIVFSKTSLESLDKASGGKK